MSFKHSTKFSFGSEVYHRVTGDKGQVFGIILRENRTPSYLVIFRDSRKEEENIEAELSEEPIISTPTPT